MKTPKLTVIIPVYNAEDYIERCLNSLINQTLQDIEFIFINDCSTDNSAKIIHKFAREDKRIVLLNNAKNIGTGASRNKGFNYAAGKYIGFVDNDDFVDSDYFESMVQKIEEKNADVCIALKIINHTKTKKRTHIIKPKDLREAVFVQRTAPWAKIYSKEFLTQNKIKFDCSRGEDIFPAFLCAYLSSSTAYSKKSAYHCFIRDNSVSHKNITLDDLAEIKVYEKIFEFLSGTFNKEEWIEKVKKRGMISFDFLYSNANSKEMKKLVIEEYKRVFLNFSIFNYYVWKLFYKKEKLVSYLRGIYQ